MNDSGILFLWWLDRNDPETWKALYAANGGFPIGKSGLLGENVVQILHGNGGSRCSFLAGKSLRQ